jgi:predicted  nucleic acid-binding Zn-ribbon protein
MTRGDINSEINMQEKSEANKDPEDAKQSGVNLNYYLMRFEALIRENEAHKRDKESLNVEIACIEVERDELEKELEELKAFRDKVKPTYTVGSKKVNLIASEPDPPKYTR